MSLVYLDCLLKLLISLPNPPRRKRGVDPLHTNGHPIKTDPQYKTIISTDSWHHHGVLSSKVRLWIKKHFQEG